MPTQSSEGRKLRNKYSLPVLQVPLIASISYAHAEARGQEPLVDSLHKVWSYKTQNRVGKVKIDGERQLKNTHQKTVVFSHSGTYGFFQMFALTK